MKKKEYIITLDQYAIIILLSEEIYGSVLGEYFYNKDKYMKEIKTHGDLKGIVKTIPFL